MVGSDVASRKLGVTANSAASAHSAARIPKAVARAPAVAGPSGTVPATTNPVAAVTRPRSCGGSGRACSGRPGLRLDLDTARGPLGMTVVDPDLPEARRLWETINDWWEEIETFIGTGVTSPRTEAASTAIKHIKRTGRGYRNRRRYQVRILLRSHRQTRRRRTRLNQQATTANC